jgi:hypothetical protein
MRDIGTMVWKEGRDTIFPRGRLGNLSSLVFIALLGIAFPLIDRVGWLTISVQMVLLNLLFSILYILVYMGIPLRESVNGTR